jgi:fatty acid-binding protein DegV
VLSLIDGSITSVARVSAKADSVAKAVEYLEARVDRGAAAWVAISHGNVPEKAQALATALGGRYRCEKLIVRPLSPSIYLHVGPGALVTFVYPLAGLPFIPA